MTLRSRVASAEIRAARPAAVRFAWLDWWANGAGVAIDGRSFLRAGDETDEQLAERAIETTRARCPDCRIVVVSWRHP